MSQNNDWLAYEKSGSCRTDSLMHKVVYNSSYQAYQKAKERLNNNSDNTGKIKGKKSRVIDTTTAKYINNVLSKLESAIESLTIKARELEAAYRSGSRQAFVEGLSKYYNVYNQIENALNAEIPGTSTTLGTVATAPFDYPSSYDNGAVPSQDISFIVENTRRLAALYKKYKTQQINTGVLNNMKRKFGLT